MQRDRHRREMLLMVDRLRCTMRRHHSSSTRRHLLVPSTAGVAAAAPEIALVLRIVMEVVVPARDLHVAQVLPAIIVADAPDPAHVLPTTAEAPATAAVADPVPGIALAAVTVTLPGGVLDRLGEGVAARAKIMVTSLPQYADRDTLNILLARQGFHPVDIRVVRRTTDAGGQRVFGFIEFSDPAQSQQWMNHNDGYLRFEDGFSAKLEYSREDSTSYAERRSAGLGAPPNPASDWTCAKVIRRLLSVQSNKAFQCTINNFNRRNSCFKCGTTREDSEALEAKGYGMVGVTPCDSKYLMAGIFDQCPGLALLIRELPVGVTEESVRASLARYTNVPILRLQISPSRRYTLIQLRSVEDASYLLSTFNKVVPYIDNCAVIVTFARLSLNQIVVAENVNALKSQVGLSSAHMHEDPTNSAAQLAHNAIQIAQMGRQMATGGLQESVQNISTPVGVFPIYPAPNRHGFQFEPSSGYYYDSSTGFYFDAKTEYYFNTQTNQWMFWCAKYSTYIPCEGGDLEMKKRLQDVDKAPGGLGASSSAVGAAPVAASGNE
ncbi:G-patch domain containing protein, partial [Aphelenchoides avenae]